MTDFLGVGYKGYYTYVNLTVWQCVDGGHVGESYVGIQAFEFAAKLVVMLPAVLAGPYGLDEENRL